MSEDAKWKELKLGWEWLEFTEVRDAMANDPQTRWVPASTPHTRWYRGKIISDVTHPRRDIGRLIKEFGYVAVWVPVQDRYYALYPAQIENGKVKMGACELLSISAKVDITPGELNDFINSCIKNRNTNPFPFDLEHYVV